MNTFAKVVIASLTMVGVAAAQPKAPDAKGAPAAPAPKAPAPKDAKAPVPVDPAKPAAPEMPKPPAELAAMAKASGGTWRCTGTSSADEKGTMAKMTATMKSRHDLDKWWITDTFDATMGKMKFKFVGFTTYDASSKKWRRVMMDNQGGQMVGTSDGLVDGKMTFNMDSMGPRGSSQFRDHSDHTDAKAPKFWGEMSMDKGKTWMKVYEMGCKK
ncbi:MAG TPA: DUF1579 family protein [Kofleriaceae bacterium]